MIFTTNANTLQYATTTGSSWSNYAYQGAYGSGKPRIGAILFNALRSSVNWADMQVTQVDLWVDFGTAGASRRKTLGLWTTSRNSIGGTGSAMLGQSIGQVLTSSTTYGRDETITFNTSTNAAAFANLRTWIENSASNGLAIYLNETAGSSSYSANYTNITAARLTITYEVKGSKGTVTPVSADVGQEVTLNIEPITSEYVVSHTAQWVCGDSASQIYSLAGGVTETTYTIPSGWLNELEGVTEKAARCVLTTYENGAEKATREIPFTVTAPDNYIPHIESFSVTRYTTAIDDYGQTVYIPDVSGGHVWVNAALEIDRDGGLNPGTAYIVYYPADDPQNSNTVNLTWPNDTLTLTDDRTVITTQIPTGAAYIFELHAANGHTDISRQARVEKSRVLAHFAGSGWGLGIGMYSDGTQQHPKVQVAFPIYDGDGNRLGGTVWDAGDTFTLPMDVYFPGLITNSGNTFHGTLFLGGWIKATRITLEGAVVLRGGSGYVNGMSYQTGIGVGDSGYTFSAEIANARAGIVHLTIVKSSAFTNVTNNTPVMGSFAPDRPLTLTFGSAQQGVWQTEEQLHIHNGVTAIQSGNTLSIS